MVAGLAAVNQVVAFAAVRHETDGRQFGGRQVGKQQACVNDVVACVVVRIGQREHPLVVLVLAIGQMDERVEGLVAELVAAHVRRETAVPDAVLRGVTVDHQWGVWPRATGDRDVVAAHAHLARFAHARATQVVAEHVQFDVGGRRERHVLQRHHRRRQFGHGESTGQAGHINHLALVEAIGQPIARSARDGAVIVAVNVGTGGGDAHRPAGFGLERIDHRHFQANVAIRCDRQTVEHHFAVRTGALERIALDVGAEIAQRRLFEAGDLPRTVEAFDGHELVDDVPVILPVVPVAALDEVGAKVDLRIEFEREVPAAVHQRQAAVQAGHRERAGARTVGQRVAAHGHHRRGDVDDAPAAFQTVDQQQLALLEAVVLPIAGRSRDRPAAFVDVAAADVGRSDEGNRQGHHYRVVGRLEADQEIAQRQRVAGQLVQPQFGVVERVERVVVGDVDHLERPEHVALDQRFRIELVNCHCLPGQEALGPPVPTGLGQH